MVELLLGHPPVFHQPVPGVAPEALYAVDAVAGVAAPDELALAVADAVVVPAAPAHEAVVGREAVGVGRRGPVDPALDGLRRRLPRDVRDYLGVDPPDTLEQPEDDGLPPGPAPPHAPHPPGAEVALVRLDLAGEGRPLLADLGYPRPEQSVAAVRGATAEAGRLSRRGGRHVGVERLRQLPELALEEMRFCDVPIPRSLSAAHGLIKESFQALN